MFNGAANKISARDLWVEHVIWMEWKFDYHRVSLKRKKLKYLSKLLPILPSDWSGYLKWSFPVPRD